MISKLRKGDKVLATNTKTGKTSAETVAAVLVHHDTDLYDLRIRTSRGTAVIDTTRSHPFWVPGASGDGGRWVKAGALRYGTHLQTPDGAEVVVIGGWMPRHRDGWMWDLNVPGNDDHDFYVDAAASRILVHNACSSTSGNNSDAVLGKQAHSAFSDMLNETGNGYSGAQGVGGGLRSDGVYTDPATGDQIPLELKPASNPAQLSRGWSQLAKYGRTLGSPAGSGQLWTWAQEGSGNCLFRRVL